MESMEEEVESYRMRTLGMEKVNKNQIWCKSPIENIGGKYRNPIKNIGGKSSIPIENIGGKSTCNTHSTASEKCDP